MNKYDLLKLWFGNEDDVEIEIDCNDCIDPEGGQYGASFYLQLGEIPNEIVFNGMGWKALCGNEFDYGISELYATYKNCGHEITLRLI